MNANILIDELKTSEERIKIFNMTSGKIEYIQKVILDLQTRKNEVIDLISKEKANYDIGIKQYSERKISTAQFTEIEKNYKHRRDALDLKKVTLDMEIQANHDLMNRLRCLCWLLKIPYGVEKVRASKPSENKIGIIHKNDIYDRYFDLVITSEKDRLKNEQSLLRLKIDFNNMNDYPVHPNHEFYADVPSTSEKLIKVQDDIESLDKYIGSVDPHYSTWMNTRQLTIGDFYNQNSEQLYEKFFIADEQRRKAI